MKTKVCVIAAIAICSLFAVSCNNQPKEVPAEEVVVEEVETVVDTTAAADSVAVEVVAE